MRIAYVVSQYPAINHGYVLREIQELRRIGFDVRVASVRRPDRDWERLSEEEQEERGSTFYIKGAGIRTWAGAHGRVLWSRPGAYFGALLFALGLGGWRMGAGLRNLVYFAQAVGVADWMRRKKLAQVHTHYSSTVILIARRMWPMRASATIHGSDEFGDPRKYYLKQKAASFDMLRTISEYGRERLAGIAEPAAWGKIRVSRLGVDARGFRPRPFRWDPSPFEIVFVGRLVTGKGLYVLLDAVARLAEEGRKVRLRIAGDGRERAGLEKRVAKLGLTGAVIFEGWQNAEDVETLYRQADIFALPSFAEGIPVVLMEAMAMRVASVATAVGGVPELIRHGVDGLLVEPGDERGLAEALGRLMDDAELRMRLGKSGRRRVEEHYDLRRNTAEFGEMLREAGGRVMEATPMVN